ncbi:MAG TPA: hypothetical protein VG939_05820, partial [Caulobacteraceae bacterium]|nr:hypothetical protein [Caulobacteraceae bacterium]
ARALARRHTDAAIEALAQVVREGKTDAARVAAAKELLDRGHGRAGQGGEGGAPDGGLVLARIVREIIDPKAVADDPDP